MDGKKRMQSSEKKSVEGLPRNINTRPFDHCETVCFEFGG